MQFNARGLQTGGQCLGAIVAETTAFIFVLADMHQSSEERPGRDDHCGTEKIDIQVCLAARNLAARKKKSRHRSLEQLEVGLEFQRML